MQSFHGVKTYVLMATSMNDPMNYNGDLYDSEIESPFYD